MIIEEAIPLVIFSTLIIGLILLKRTNMDGVFTIDGFLSAIGVLLGLFILSLNLIYTNNYLITIGPLLVVVCLAYLRHRNEMLITNNDFNLELNTKKLKLIKIVYWICIVIGLISYYHTFPYHRSSLFFISMSIGISMISLEIFFSKKDYNESIKILAKILLISIIIRSSAYFISPYPIGSDPWGHSDFINDIYKYGSLNVPLTFTSQYYLDYPIMHIYATIICLIGDISTKYSMSLIGLIATISTLFVYLIAKNITKDTRVSLMAGLLINFADFHIRWSIEVIAMTFGIALFTLISYIIIKKDFKNQVNTRILLIFLILIISWTHTISSFILLLSMISLYVGSLLYNSFYPKNNIGKLSNFEKPFIKYNVSILFSVILLFHWMDPRYAFFQAVTRGLVTALSQDASFLGRTSQSIDGSFASILNIFGFLIFIVFGIIGSLYSLSKKHVTQIKFSVVFTQFVLFFIFFIFPAFGIPNLSPDRWPAFIYVFFSIFVGVGLIQFINLISKKSQILLLLIIIFTSSFFMITNSSTNRDSPIYGEELNEKLIWTESEVFLFTNVNKLYNGVIVSDPQTVYRPFKTYLKREEVKEFSENLDWNLINDKMFIWRKVTLTSSVYDKSGHRIFYGNDLRNGLEIHLNNIYDTGNSRAYLGRNAL